MDPTNSSRNMDIFGQQAPVRKLAPIDDSAGRYIGDLIRRPEVIVTIIALAAIFILPILLPTGIGLAITIPTLVISIALTVGLAFLRIVILPLFVPILSKSYGAANESINTEFKLKDGTMLRGNIYNTRSFDPSIAIEDRKIVYIFGGNGQFSTNYGLKDFMDTNLLMKQNYHQVIHLDYRGCAHSSGYSTSNKRLVKDGIEVLSYLIDQQGIKPENMLLIGHSIGGTVAPSVKEILDQKYADREPTSLIANQTGYTLRNFLSFRIQGTSPILKIIRPILTAITSLLMKVIGWDYNFSFERWNNLKGNKISYGGYNDTLFPEPNCLTYRNKVGEDNLREDSLARTDNYMGITGVYRNAAHCSRWENLLPESDSSGKWIQPESEDRPARSGSPEEEYSYLDQNQYAFAGK